MKNPKAPAPDNNAVFRLFNEIGIIDQLATARFERGLPHGLTAAQFGVLNNFARLGGDRTPGGLASAFQVTRATMTSTLQKLEAKGFVELTPDPADGRGKRVAITKSGLRARDDSLRGADPQFDDLNDAISAKELNKILPVLEKLRKWLDAHR